MYLICYSLRTQNKAREGRGTVNELLFLNQHILVQDKYGYITYSALGILSASLK